MTEAEREQYRRWWIEESGLGVAELYEIAVGLSSPDKKSTKVGSGAGLL